jgi:hypothetical protein
MQDPSLTSFVTPRNGHGEAHFPTASTSRNGNGYQPAPLSRKAFFRSVPRRLGAIEDAVDIQETRMNEVVCRLTSLEVRPAVPVPDPATRVILDFVTAVLRLADQARPRNARGQFIRYADRRSTHSR